MNIQLGKKIRNLRKEKNISQEVLANHLNVTFQTVSKWENDISMPDVTLIPAIASFFGISTDELFDYNLYEIEKKVEAIVDEYRKYYDNDYSHAEKILRDGLKQYPANDTLLNCLLTILPIPEQSDEVITLCKQLIENTRHDEIRLDAYRIMAEAYKSIGEYALCQKAIEQIPEIYFSKLSVSAQLLTREEQFEAAIKQQGIAFESTIDMCMILADYYQSIGEHEKSRIELQMSKDFILASKPDFSTKFTKGLFHAFEEKLTEIENRLEHKMP